MLMLGESVLSLLIVDIVETSDYYKTFIVGIISIVLLEYLHFQNQPRYVEEAFGFYSKEVCILIFLFFLERCSDPDKHALRRSLLASFAFYWIYQVYSLSLIVLGASYKMLLWEFLYMEEYEDSHRRSLLFPGLEDRWLAGGTSAALRFPSENRQQRIAHFFCGSMALVFFCMDAISLAHRGASDNWKECECTESKRKKLLALLLVASRAGVVVFIATLSQYETEPDNLATIGLFSIFAQLLLRALGCWIFRHDEEDAEEQALERMINYTAARVHDRPDPADSRQSAGKA